MLAAFVCLGTADVWVGLIALQIGIYAHCGWGGLEPREKLDRQA